MTEFELIRHYFAAKTKERNDVRLGIGDDAAIANVPAGHELVITTDTLINGVHFPTTTSPADIGYKALAVNLSDLAAMGATPAWITLALTLPTADPTWIASFCDGLFLLANQYQVALIGGDTTRGPLSITIQAMGFVPTGKALLRSAAKPGDLIYVTGTLGDAARGLLNPQYPELLSRLNRPEPRIATGTLLSGLAHAAIDISDGFVADLKHILLASHVGATVHLDQLPISHPEALAYALTGGDDYELCFTIPPEKREELEKKHANIPCRLSCVGTIHTQLELQLLDNNGNPYHGPLHGYQHF